MEQYQEVKTYDTKVGPACESGHTHCQYKLHEEVGNFNKNDLVDAELSDFDSLEQGPKLIFESPVLFSAEDQVLYLVIC
jgi:hypothetical protein